MYYAASDESLNSQSRLAAAYSGTEVSPTAPNNFRFPISNQLKGYGARNTSPLYQEIPERHANGIVDGDVLRHKSAQSVAKSIKPEELYNNENHYISTKNSEEVWHYPKPEVDYVYGAFSSGNSSIITIESTISEDSEYDEIYNKRNRLPQHNGSNMDALNYHPCQRSKSDILSGDYSREPDHIYDVIGNVHRGKVKPPVKTTNIIGLRSGDISPIYEVPIPDGEGEIILPVQVKRTPVMKRNKKLGAHQSKAEDVARPKSNKETML